jgi:hypothetical protein
MFVTYLAERDPERFTLFLKDLEQGGASFGKTFRIHFGDDVVVLWARFTDSLAVGPVDKGNSATADIRLSASTLER